MQKYQQAVKLALALGNPTLKDNEWAKLKERFSLEDVTISDMKLLIDVCEKNNLIKLLKCLV